APGQLRDSQRAEALSRGAVRQGLHGLHRQQPLSSSRDGRVLTGWKDATMMDIGRIGILVGAGVLAAAGAMVACQDTGGGTGGSGGTTGTGGSGGAGPTGPFQPAGCKFEVAPRAEYTDWAAGK